MYKPFLSDFMSDNPYLLLWPELSEIFWDNRTSRWLSLLIIPYWKLVYWNRHNSDMVLNTSRWIWIIQFDQPNLFHGNNGLWHPQMICILECTTIIQWTKLKRLKLTWTISDVWQYPTLPYVLSSSDDMLIKLWDWDKGWICTQIFEGHSHYVMQVAFNPKDKNTFASVSLDRTIKVWRWI